MSSPLPSNMALCTVRGRYGASTTVPGQSQPQFMPYVGMQVTFSPAYPFVTNMTATPSPVVIATKPRQFITDSEGYLSDPVDGFDLDGKGHNRNCQIIASDDPDITPTNWKYLVTFTGPGATNFRAFRTPAPAGAVVDMAIITPQRTTTGTAPTAAEIAAANAAASAAAAQSAVASIHRGQAGGVAPLDNDGDVNDAFGNKILGGGGGGGGGSNPDTTLLHITDMSPLARQLNTDTSQAAMRARIGAGTGNGTSNLVIGTTAGTAADAAATNIAIAGRATDSAVVHKTGDETIAGVKTYTSPQVIVAATADDNPVTRAQLNTSVSSKADASTVSTLSTTVSGHTTQITALQSGTGTPTTPQGEQILVWDATSQTYKDATTGVTTYDTSKYSHRFRLGPDPRLKGYTPALYRDWWLPADTPNPGTGNPNSASVGLTSWPIASVDGVRGNAEMVMYTYRVDQIVSPANQYGIEVVFDTTTKVPVALYNRFTNTKYTDTTQTSFTGPTPIAANQFILSGHGNIDQPGYPGAWLWTNFTRVVTGNTRVDPAKVVTLNNVTVPPTNPPTPPAPTGTWMSGQSDTLTTKDGSFAAWRGRSVEIGGNWGPEVNSLMAEGPSYEITQGGTGAYANVPALDYAIGAFGTGTTWAQAASGTMDAIWTQTVLNLKAAWGTRAANKMFIRIAHEFNGNWYPWAVAPGDVTNYINGFRRFVGIIRNNFPGAQIVWSMNAGSSYSYDIRSLYPGDAYVDVISTDDYNRDPFVSTQGAFDTQIVSDSTTGGTLGMETVRLFALAHGKPMALSEWSNSGIDNGGGGGESPAFMIALYNWLAAHGGTGAGNVMYEVLFNVPGYGDHYTLFPESLETGNTTTAAKYKELWSGGLSVPPTDPPPASGALPSKVMSIWHHRWSGPNLSAYPTNVQNSLDLVVLGLAQSGGSGTGNLTYQPNNGQSVAAHATDIRAFVAKGIDVVMGFGGSSDGGITITNSAQVDQAFNSFSSFRTTYGITGIDIDLEPSGSSWNQASIVSLVTRLKTAFGPGFIVGVTPGLYDPYTARWMALAQALGANMDYMAPMLYDFPEANVAGTGSGSLAGVALSKCNTMAGAGIPESKMILGFMMKPPAESYPNSTDSTAKLTAAYAYVKAAKPGLRGAFLWEDKIQLARAWDGVLALAPVVHT